MEFLTGDFSGVLNNFIILLRGIGAFFTVADFILVAKFISSISDDGF
jgi:hypothetical protein